MSKSLAPWILALAIACIGAAMYSGGLGGGFIFDDYPNLVENPDWNIHNLSIQSLKQVLFSGVTSDAGRPLAMLSFAVDHALFGMAPQHMKLVNAIWHLINTLLIFVLIQQLIDERWTATRRYWSAAVIATAWMLHPLQVSTVLYIIQRMELVACTGTLISLTAYLQARRCATNNRTAWPWWLLAGSGAALAIGFKETAILIPGYTLALEIFILRFRTMSHQLSKRLLASYALGLTATAAIFLLMILPSALSASTYAARSFTLKERLITQPVVLMHYLRQIFAPWPESLCFYYDNFPTSHSWLTPPAPFFCFLALSGLLIAALLQWRRWPLTALGATWLLISHALTSNVIPLELAFEHRNYFSIFCVLLALMQPCQAALRRMSPSMPPISAAIVIAFLASMSWVQIRTWAEPTRLALTLTTRNPNSPRAGYEYGRRLITLSEGDTSSPAWSMAEREFQRAANLPGDSPLPEQALIIMRTSHGQSVPAATWSSLRSKLAQHKISPSGINALDGITSCRVSGRCSFRDEKELFLTLTSTIDANPDADRLHAIFADYAFHVLNDPNLAITSIRKAVRLRPGETGYWIWLTRIGLASNLLSEAEAEEAIMHLNARGGSKTNAIDITNLRHFITRRTSLKI